MTSDSSVKLTDRPLRICLLSYRSNPHSGGQGVYTKNLGAALIKLGHQVDILSGPPSGTYPKAIPVHHLNGLDLYDPANPFRMPSLRELADPFNFIEWLGVSTMGFPEPFTFGLRAYQYLKRRLHRYDIIHDNQSLSYGVWALSKLSPTLATIHHPITVDRDIAIKSAATFWKKLQHLRWYSFVGMQRQVAQKLPKIITVSTAAKNDLVRAFKIPPERFRVVPNGINIDVFHPLPEVRRKRARLIVTNSADVPLKGLYYLLQAVANIVRRRKVQLVVIGSPKKRGGIERLVAELGLNHHVFFTGRIPEREFVQQYAEATLAIVPSIYEGFGLPAGEAMACGVPIISTTGGALPEVVGDAGILVPPADADALTKAITLLLDNPEMAESLGNAGYRRVHQHFTWEKSAERTITAYWDVINDHGRF